MIDLAYRCYAVVRTISFNSVPKAKFLNLLKCWRSPKQPVGLVIQYEDSENSASSHTEGYDLLQQNAAKQNQQRERLPGWSLEKTRHQLPESSPTGVTQDVRSPSSIELRTGTTHPKCFLPGRLVRDSVVPVLLGVGRSGTLRLGLPKRKAAVQHEARCLSSLGRRSPSFQFWKWWELSRNPDCPAKGQPFRKAFLSITVSGLSC